MTEQSELLALAERVEKLAGPDREVDGSIAWAMGQFDRFQLGPETTVSLYRIDEYERAEIHVIGPKGGRMVYTDDCPRYTSSLDAAMTLALPSWWFSASLPLSPDAYGYSREDQRMPRAGFEMIGPPYSAAAIAATLPLAIAAAALRAHANSL